MLPLLALIALQVLDPAPATPFDRAFVLEVSAADPILEGHGPSKRVQVEAQFSGTLHVWTKAARDLDLFLRLEDGAGTLVAEDDDAGGGNTPYVKLEVESGRVFSIRVAAAQGAHLGAFELHAVAAVESGATRSVAEITETARAEIKALRARGELAPARDVLTQVLAEIAGMEGANSSDVVARSAWSLAGDADALGLTAAALRARTITFAQCSRTLPGDHAALQSVRQRMAGALADSGDLAGARALDEQVLEVYSRTRPDDDLALQHARGNLAVTLKAFGEYTRARELEERVLEVRSRVLPADHPDLSSARANLAVTIGALGDLAEARTLQEQVLASSARVLPDDHPALATARENLADTLRKLGDLARARELEEKVLEARSRSLPSDHAAVQMARQNLAITRKALGDLVGARALFERVLEVYARTRPPEDHDLARARGNLAATIKALGDLAGARALEEQVLETLSRSLPADHRDLQAARQNLARTLLSSGDAAAAQTLLEAALKQFELTLPAEHPDVLAVRENLALAIKAQGDLDRARALQEELVDACSRTRSADDPELQASRANLATTLEVQGDLDGARALEELVLEARVRTLPVDHPDLASARSNLAWTLAHVLARLPASERWVGAGAPTRERCAELMRDLCRTQCSSAREALVSSSPREAEARCGQMQEFLDTAMSFAAGVGVFDRDPELDRESFLLGEMTRGAALGCAALARTAAARPGYAALREELRVRTDELARLVRKGATSEEFQAARARRDAVERELVALARDTTLGRDLDVGVLAERLDPNSAVVAFRRYRSTRIVLADEAAAGSPMSASAEETNDVLCAFVVRSARNPARVDVLTRVELGPVASVEQAVYRWRASLGAALDARGAPASTTPSSPNRNGEGARELRRIVLDPLRDALRGSERAILVLDDVLHVVPWDALPADDADARPSSEECVGDRLRIETRVTVTEMLAPDATVAAGGDAIVVGGVDYDGEGVVSGTGGERDRASRAALWTMAFRDLPATRDEAQAIADTYAQRDRDASAPVLLTGTEATHERFIELAPKASWLHVATHGWFAPESIPSWQDPEPLDQYAGLGMRMSGEAQVRGMSPLLLCGLALAGANRHDSAFDRAPGWITAEEIAALDLSQCELAVLSACDTNVGVRRAGQGVASLQKALQMAGARSVITSLWKVPDEATKELMLDFYRRLWVERKPKWQALWEAKTKLRETKDASGVPKYTTRDWAAWVLTGNPD